MFPNIRQSPEYGYFLEKIGWTVGREKEFQYYVRKIPLLGNFLKIPKPFILSEVEGLKPPILDKLAKKYHAFAVCVDYSPIKTLFLDLTPSLDTILSQTKKDCRYEIRKAQKNNLTVRVFQPQKSPITPISPISQFIKMWNENAHRRGFWVPFKKEIRAIYEAFGPNAYLFLAYLPENPQTPQVPQFPISGALILTSSHTASYFHAASTPEGRKLAAPSLVVWEAIKLAKKKGCQVFDFEGIQDPRDKNTKKWGGFTHFKKSFGGREVEYPLTITKYYHPLVRLLFSLFP